MSVNWLQHKWLFYPILILLLIYSTTHYHEIYNRGYRIAGYFRGENFSRIEFNL